jgi:PhzF family phenazine biosynthesis protein
MTIPYFHVDAFADQPFGGNRAGVCLLEKALDQDLMQRIADETCLAETSFVWRQGSQFRLQWFTPLVELPLCGHGTLATAHILWEQGWWPREKEIVFDTAGGHLGVRYLAEGWLEMNFPAFASSPASLPAELTGLFPDPLRVMQTNQRWLIELDGEERVRGFVPDFEKLRDHSVIITSRADPGSSFDFVSRFFAGPVGVPEDPVTGSAHCSLGPYWSESLGKTEFLAYQVSARGGIVKVKLEKAQGRQPQSSNFRALLAGKAITLIGGQIYL